MNTLLANSPLLDSIRHSLTAGPDKTELTILAVSVAVFLIVLVVVARYFNADKPKPPRPKVDYLTLLVDLLGLTEEDRHDLQRMARVIGMEQPAAMLLAPGNLAHAVRHPRLGPPEREFIKRMNDLSQRLFDQPLPPPAEPAP